MPTNLRSQRLLQGSASPTWRLHPTPEDVNALQAALNLSELLGDTRATSSLRELGLQLRTMMQWSELESFMLDDAIQLLLIVGRMPAQLIQYNWEQRDLGCPDAMVVIPELSDILMRLVQLGFRIAQHVTQGRSAAFGEARWIQNGKADV